MSELDSVYYSGRFEYVEFGHDVPEGDFARFVVLFIKMLLKTFELENEKFPSSKRGRKSYSLCKMMSLVYYSYSRGFTEASVIADMLMKILLIILLIFGAVFLNISFPTPSNSQKSADLLILKIFVRTVLLFNLPIISSMLSIKRMLKS